ncbi:MAG: NAD(P)H-binding protein [Candidatus Lokiarchaeota archaeon]|nr:NAD(P)H-binding protein [Candidatus Lokiarchaeota archaeon]
MENRVLGITGANGFIGANLIVEARKQNWHVKGIVRRQESADYIKKLGADPFISKHLEYPGYREAFKDCAAVVHLIGIIDGSSQEFHKIHVDATRLVLESAESVGVSRVIFVSGLGVDYFGKAEWANNDYFGSKWEAEQLLPKYSVPFVSFRPSYIFGPESYWFESLFRGIQKAYINIIGDGLVPMQPIYVKDVTSCFLSAAQGLGKDNAYYDLVGPEVTNMSEMVNKVIYFYNKIRKTSHKVTLHHIPYTEVTKKLNISIEKASVSQCDVLGDNTPLKTELGVIMTPLDFAIDETIQNFMLL